jgi:hypothetical protein
MKRPPVLGIATALAVGLAAGLLVLRAGAPPELTESALEAARERWEAAGPASYTLDLQMSGALSDRRHVEVRNGRVVEMTIDGDRASEGAWEYWSVDGLFDTMATELANARQPPASLGLADGSQLVLRASFDRELGYPTRFLRHIMGHQRGTEWEVVAFDRVD